MRLRLTLLLILLAALAMPWAGFQLVRQTEVLLREGQERAQVAAAQALARAITAQDTVLPPAGTGLYVHARSASIVLDGSGDEWSGLEASRSSDGRLAVRLAIHGDALYALVEVADATRVRADVAPALGPPGDRVELTLRDAYGLRRWTIANAAPGPLAARDDQGLPLAGEWVETPSGYRIEVRLPRPGPGGALGLAAMDETGSAAPAQALTLAPGTDDPLPLLTPDARLDKLLTDLAPPGARLRALSADAWVLGQGGSLVTGDAAASADGGSSGWRAGVYRLLFAPPEEGGAGYAANLVRLDAPVVWQALSGVAASSVRAGASGDAVIVAAAVPLLRDGRPRGALLLEQASDALLVVADRGVFAVLAATLATVLLGALVLFGYAGVLSLRIRRLRNAAERALRPDGRLDPHLPHLAARGDLGDLSRSFARLLGELGAYNEYLRTLASKLSHELSTPLAIVRSSLDNLEHERLAPEARTYAQRARDGADRLAGILRSMSEASRVERSIDAAEGEEFDLAELVRGCAEAYRDVAAPRRVEADVPAGAMTFHGAPDLIAQALDKLVSNARSFAPEGGWIRLRLTRAPDGARVAVANNGPPLPARMHDRLFDSMVSVREGLERGRDESPHLGLGLFIVRLVAELHGGEASATNLPDGAGVEFTLHLKGMPRRHL